MNSSYCNTIKSSRKRAIKETKNELLRGIKKIYSNTSDIGNNNIPKKNNKTGNNTATGISINNINNNILALDNSKNTIASLSNYNEHYKTIDKAAHVLQASKTRPSRTGTEENNIHSSNKNCLKILGKKSSAIPLKVVIPAQNNDSSITYKTENNIQKFEDDYYGLETPISSVETTPLKNKDLPYKATNNNDTSTLLTPNNIPIDFINYYYNNQNRCHKIFEIPEILEKILLFVGDSTLFYGTTSDTVNISKKNSNYFGFNNRRKPESFNHALLQCGGDKEKASELYYNHANTFSNNNTPKLYSCLTVNKLWCRITVSILYSQHLTFNNTKQLEKFITTINNQPLTFKLLTKGTYKLRPESLIFNKLKNVKRLIMDIDNTKLHTIEFNILPKLVELPMGLFAPNSSTTFNTGTNRNGIKVLKLPGCESINNDILHLIAPNLPSLETLDLRSCHNISDAGVVSVLQHCPKLRHINLGRKRKCDKITDLILQAIIKFKLTNLQTLGLAGCYITDYGLWILASNEIAVGFELKRLSCNDCKFLSNFGLPRILSNGGFPHLQVLEIRHLEKLTQLKEIFQFKLKSELKGVPILVECCERLENLLQIERNNYNVQVTSKLLQDLSLWANDCQ
ncbi:uncharacterized protein SCODWIG_03652 [Saccharomycodes ludwigii]|uniref:Antagonist of mitotic exit network protein 1 n=1 Tax=Saccharomycodes ludwigii TaxID=36035 RepID=A0A376BBC4_9ASCO|nr:uncharacterized protein SCODWIG_03652 [Saccharomycodes ludwigii]